MLSEKELAFIKTQRIVHFATVSSDLQPDVVPLGWEFDGDYFYVGGRENTTTRKYKNSQVNEKVALVFDFDDQATPKIGGVKIYGTADLVHRDGRTGLTEYIRVRPEVHWSWGIEGEVFVDGKAQFKRTAWDNGAQ
jgi:pyridoxamine 5'-phosphate oxidase family protein